MTEIGNMVSVTGHSTLFAWSRLVLIASIRKWPPSIRRIFLLLGFLAIASYLDFGLLDLDGSRITTLYTRSWTDFETSSGETERLIQAPITSDIPLVAEWTACSRWIDPVPAGPSVQPPCRRILPRIPRTPQANHSSSPSTDPA